MWEKISKQSIINIISLITIVGCFILLYLMQVKEIPAGNKDLVLTATGFVFGNGMGSVYGYFFSRSKTDEKK